MSSHEPSEQENSMPPASDAGTKYRPLRIWPPLLLLVGMGVTWMIPRLVQDGPSNMWMFSAFGPALCGLLVLVWWLTFSRATWQERLTGFFGIVLIFFLTMAVADRSMRGPATTVMTIPLGLAGFAIGTILFGRILDMQRTFLAMLIAALGFSVTTLVRADGFWGNFAMGIQWRFAPSPEEKMLAERNQQTAAGKAEVVSAAFTAEQVTAWLANPEWPSYRGPLRDGTLAGPALETNWSANPPKLIWKVPVGPGWSSFAVAGKMLFSQEQRGAYETIVCYDADSGHQIWERAIESRFEDSLGGPGPRATPTLANNKMFILGASGQFMRLDPANGAVVWEQDLRKIADRDPPMWGFCSSPLVSGSTVIVYAGGSGDKGTLGFDVETGELRWSVAAGDHSYSSPHPGEILGEPVVMMLTNQALDLLNPETGEVRLSYAWNHEGYRACQPYVVGRDSIVIPTGMGTGTRRIQIKEEEGKWSATEQWTSRNLKADFNDFVVFEGNIYGFDDAVFTCLDLETGERHWKAGRYGKGQVVLLEASKLLLIIGEQGELVLLQATPDGHKELAKIQGLEGKTWNHPVVIGDRLYLRNSQEAACYELPLSKGQANDQVASTTARMLP